MGNFRENYHLFKSQHVISYHIKNRVYFYQTHNSIIEKIMLRKYGFKINVQYGRNHGSSTRSG